MLVLRKEIKLGVAAGLGILGIAGVYGLMASLSNNGTVADKDATVAVATDDDAAARQRAVDAAVQGLPPKEKDEVAVVTPPPFNPADAKNDPFAESKRIDGNTNDVWSSALTTGRIGDVTSKGSRTTDAPAIIKSPTAPKPDSRMATIDAFDSKPDAKPDSKTSAPSKSTKSANAVVASAGKYTVQPGDTFSTIAAKVYGSKKYSTALVKANPDVSPSRMKVGHEINVPPKEAVASIGGAIETAPTQLVAPIDATRQYRVAAGDTLSRISTKLYGKSTEWQAIYEANKAAIGPNEAKLKLGMLLDLPQKPVR